MHCVNCSIFYDAFLKQSWISDENKARLLEWKGRFDLCMYASRRSPEPLLDEIVHYKPKDPESSWDRIFDRVRNYDDDGHASKLVRSLAHGEMICASYDSHDPKFRIVDGMWLQLGNMGLCFLYLDAFIDARCWLTVTLAIDSVEDTGDTWVRHFSELSYPFDTLP